ncbi:MAG TPA: toprim domain-containing protein [Longimicrobiaceae bacterium]|nr:toprim domain-containing protein [Longimicrobiaceae bacterium]
MPPRQTKAYQEARERLQRLGVLRASGHEHFRGSVVVPIFGERAQVEEVYGRKITPRLRKGTPDHLYLPDPHKGVWNREALASSEEVILCESLFDALSFWQAGQRHVSASYGVGGFTEAHLAALRAHDVRRVLIAYDADRAGDEAAERVAASLLPLGIECFRIVFPRGLDANDVLCQSGADAAARLAELVQQAVWLGKGAASPPLAALLPASISASVPATAEAPEPPKAPPPASPVPPLPEHVEPEVERRGSELLLSVEGLSFRVRGLEKSAAPDVLRVNLLLRQGERFHVDTLDLYAAKPRALFVSQAARELGLKEEPLKKALGAVLLKLEALREGGGDEEGEEGPARSAPQMSEAEAAAALHLLRSADLLSRILADFRRSGVVGEETNKLVGYLAAVSRKLERPLAIIVQSSSAAGKTSLMDAVLAFVPSEEKVQYSALTGQSLFYMEGVDLRHKVLAVVEEEGAEKASYALKLLQSEGELTIASTGKDPESGRLVTQAYRVEGPVMIFLTTTAVEIDEELLNRCLVLTVNEDREQTRAIHRVQRERRTLEGLLAAQEKEEILALHQNAQRLLRPLAVVNPYAPQLTFLDSRTRTRRDHEKYLTLIDAIALLHQHQREVRRIETSGRVLEYVEVTLADIEHANRLSAEVLGRSLDELPPQTRTLLGLLDAMVREIQEREGAERGEIRFTRADVRHSTGWSDFQVKTHLRRLEELEYLLAHRGGPGQRYCYELLYAGEGEDGAPFLLGLSGVERLLPRYGPDPEGSAADREGPESHPEGARSPEGAPEAGDGSPARDAPKSHPGNRIAAKAVPWTEIAPAGPVGRRTALAVSAVSYAPNGSQA